MSETAYAVGFIDRKSLKLLGVGIFSEPEPEGKHFPVVLFKVEASSLDQAIDQALKTLAMHPEYTWLRSVVEWKRGELGQAGETPDLLARVNALEEVVAELEGRVDILDGMIVP